MNLQKTAAWANIGSFILGVLVLLRTYAPQHPVTVAPATQEGPQHLITLPMWIFLGGIVVGGLLNFLAARNQTTATVDSPPISVPLPTAVSPATVVPSRNERSESRIFLGTDITPQSICALFDGKTGVQAHALVKSYLGKWMQISGRIANIGAPDDFSGRQTVTLQSSESGTFYCVLYLFTSSWREHLSILNVGSPVTIRGKIAQIDNLTLTLDRCELVVTGQQPGQAPAA